MYHLITIFQYRIVKLGHKSRFNQFWNHLSGKPVPWFRFSLRRPSISTVGLVFQADSALQTNCGPKVSSKEVKQQKSWPSERGKVLVRKTYLWSIVIKN